MSRISRGSEAKLACSRGISTISEVTMGVVRGETAAGSGVMVGLVSGGVVIESESTVDLVSGGGVFTGSESKVSLVSGGVVTGSEAMVGIVGELHKVASLLTELGFRYEMLNGFG